MVVACLFIYQDLFPFANLGWGANPCFPYSYESFVIATRYFPHFGSSSPNSVSVGLVSDQTVSLHLQQYAPEQNHRRDLAAFFAHAVQETGENNAALYGYAGRGDIRDNPGDSRQNKDVNTAHNCFYRGGFYNWFEGGPTSGFLRSSRPGWQPEDGDVCAPQVSQRSL